MISERGSVRFNMARIIEHNPNALDAVDTAADQPKPQLAEKDFEPGEKYSNIGSTEQGIQAVEANEEFQFNRIKFALEKFNIDPERAQAILRSAEEKFDLVKEKAQQLFEKTSTVLKLAMAVGVIGIALTQAADVQLSKASMLEAPPAAAEQLRKTAWEQRYPDTDLESLQEWARSEEDELAFLVVQEGDREVTLLSESGGKYSVGVDIYGIEQMAGPETKKIVFGHTHVAKDRLVSPPSFADMLNLLERVGRFKEKNIIIGSKIIDQSGTWDISVNPDNVFLKMIEAMTDDLEKQIKQLTPEEYKIYEREAGDQLLSIELVEKLAQSKDISSKRLAAKLTAIQNSVLEKHADKLQYFTEIDEEGDKVVGLAAADYNKPTKEISSETNQAVNNFVNLCKKYGFTMSYTLNH
jgi:hypothetical protein